MDGSLGYREVLALTLEQLREHPNGQWANLAASTVEAVRRRGLVANVESSKRAIGEHVREAMWDCLLKRIIVFGSDSLNPEWPFYRLTDHGAHVLKSVAPQPYDPDGFMSYFDATCSGIDPAVRSYVAEAVHAFNSDCTRAAAVMLGCASEKLLLLLCESFEAAIGDATKKAKFSKDLAARWAISHKYTTLRDRLELMVTAKKIPHEHAETVAGELPAGFELLRRCRNAAGHPDVPGDVSNDTVFLNLRTFTEYARRVQSMITHFGATAADW